MSCTHITFVPPSQPVLCISRVLLYSSLNSSSAFFVWFHSSFKQSLRVFHVLLQHFFTAHSAVKLLTQFHKCFRCQPRAFSHGKLAIHRHTNRNHSAVSKAGRSGVRTSGPSIFVNFFLDWMHQSSKQEVDIIFRRGK